MPHGHLYFEIHAEDVHRARHFYEQLFGWTITPADNTPVPYWRIETGGCRGGLVKRAAGRPIKKSPLNAFVSFFEVDDYDAMEHKIVGLGGKITVPKFYIPKTCWTGYFIDPEANCFGLFQME